MGRARASVFQPARLARGPVTGGARSTRKRVRGYSDAEADVVSSEDSTGNVRSKIR